MSRALARFRRNESLRISTDDAGSLADVWAARPGSPDGSREWYEEALRRWLTAGMSSNTKASYERTLSDFFDFLSTARGTLVAPHEVRESDVEDYIESMLKGEKRIQSPMLRTPDARALLGVLQRAKARVGFEELVKRARETGVVLSEKTANEVLSRAAKANFVDREPKGMRGLIPAAYTYAMPEAQPASPATITQRLAALSSFFRAMRGQNGVLPGLVMASPVLANPVLRSLESWQRKASAEQPERTAARKTRPEEYRLLEAEVLGRDDSLTKARDWLLLQLFFRTGLRVSSVVGLRNKDVIEEQGKSIAKVRLKGGKHQSFALADAVVQALESYRAWLRKQKWPEETIKSALLPDAPLVCSVGRKGNARQAAQSRAGDENEIVIPLTPDGIRDIFRRYAERIAGTDEAMLDRLLERLHPHGLRHLYVETRLKVEPIQVVSKRVGHEDIRTTQRYAPPVDTSTDDKEEEIDRLIAQMPTPERRGPRPEVEVVEELNEVDDVPESVEPEEPPPARVFEAQSMVAVTGSLKEAEKPEELDEDTFTYATSPEYAYRTEPLYAKRNKYVMNSFAGDERGQEFATLGFMTGNWSLLPYRWVKGIGGVDDPSRHRIPIPCTDTAYAPDFQGFREGAEALYDTWLETAPAKAAALTHWVVYMLGLGSALRKAVVDTRKHWLAFDEPAPPREPGERKESYDRRMDRHYVRAHSAVGLLGWLDANGGAWAGRVSPKSELYKKKLEDVVEDLSILDSMNAGKIALEKFSPPDWFLVSEDPLADPVHGVSEGQRAGLEEFVLGLLTPESVLFDPRVDRVLRGKPIFDVLSTLSTFKDEADASMKFLKQGNTKRFHDTSWGDPETEKVVKVVCARLSGGKYKGKTVFNPYSMAVSEWRAAAFAIAAIPDPAQAEGNAQSMLFGDPEAERVFESLSWQNGTVVSDPDYRRKYLEETGADAQLIARRALRVLWERHLELTSRGGKGIVRGDTSGNILNVLVAWVVPGPAVLEQYAAEQLKISGRKPRLDELREAFDQAKEFLVQETVDANQQHIVEEMTEQGFEMDAEAFSIVKLRKNSSMAILLRPDVIDGVMVSNPSRRNMPALASVRVHPVSAAFALWRKS